MTLNKRFWFTALCGAPDQEYRGPGTEEDDRRFDRMMDIVAMASTIGLVVTTIVLWRL